MAETSSLRRRWKRWRYRLEWIGCRGLAGLIPLLPRRACLALAWALGALYYHLDRKSRSVARENLRLALPELSADERETVARESFANFARALLDLFWARRLRPDNFRRHIELEGFEAARALRDAHGGIVLITAHLGSYEWLSLATAFAGLPLWIVALDFKNPALDAIFGAAREHSGHRLIGRKHSMLRLLRAVRGRGGVGMLTDLGLHMNQPGVVIDCFGRKMHVTFLHALLHERTGVPIVPVTNVPLADGRCRVTAHLPLSFPAGATHQEITQATWDFFEARVRERPGLWLWNYRHWRYRPAAAPASDYPAYAATSAKFERALEGRRATPRPRPTA